MAESLRGFKIRRHFGCLSTTVWVLGGKVRFSSIESRKIMIVSIYYPLDT